MNAQKQRRGPPRRVENQTGSSSAFARAIALKLPAVEEQPHFGMPSLRVRSKVLMVLKHDERAFVRADRHDIAAHVAARPDAYTDHDGLQVNLRAVPRDELRELIEDGWRLLAPKKAVAEFDARPKPKTVTRADIRKIALSLPGAVEMLSYGVPAFCVPNKKNQGFFARIGPGISNLLPPDDADALYIPTSTEDGEALLSMHPDRFFVTPHYVGHGVLTRLSENTREHLHELAELVTDAWRRKAPRELVEQLEARRKRRGRTAD